MSIFKNILNQTLEAVTPQWLNRLMNEDFMKAFAGSCALIAAADGEIDESEKDRIRKYIANTKELKDFDSSTVLEFFNKYVNELIHGDKERGKHDIYKVLDEIKSDKEASKFLVRMCCDIGKSDGEFDDLEKKAVREICERLGVDVGNFEGLV